MKKIVTLLFILCVISVFAHEFWLQPDKFIYKKGEKATIKFLVGENFEGDNWSGNRSKINFLSLIQDGKKTDLSSALSDNKGDSLQFTLPREGTAMVVYSGLNSSIELEAAKFNAYLEEDGLKEAIEYRKQHNETDSMGREFYQRSVKTIFQVEKKYDSTYKMQTDLPLDIIPMKHPYQLKKDQQLTVKVLFNKVPLAFSLVNIWHRENNKTVRVQIQTDEYGLAGFPVKTSGRWMVSVVKMIRLQNEPKADWQSYWGSCTWGYE
jgi:uncharacterized GH25 family protein